MTKTQINALENGIYRLYWADKTISIAAVGKHANGDTWVAPVDSLTGSTANPKNWKKLNRAKRLKV
jgi:hypothetical protein